MGKKYMLKSITMANKPKVLLFLLLVVFVPGAFFSGFYAHSLLGRFDLSLLNEAYQLLDTHYIESLPEGLLLQHGMVRGMLEALEDPFTQFSEPQQTAIQSDSLAGEYGGIGALITTDGSGNYFLEPFPEGPAAEAGIRAGSRLLAIDGAPVQSGMPLDLLVSRLRGLEGTTVMLRIRQPESDKAETFELVRVNIPLPSVTDYLLPGFEDTGVVVISTFSERTATEVSASVDNLVQQNARKLIVDLRNNGGGLLRSAVEVSRLFLREGIIVYEQRRGAIQEEYRVEDPGKYLDIPIAVVVDGTTASAAEVVAAALQANGRAFLVGDTTFGKGSVQVVVELSDGSSMRITSSRWLTPARDMIDGNGLMPDFNLEPETAGSELATIRAAELLNEEIENQ